MELFIILVALVVWLGVLSLVTFLQFRFARKLTKGTKDVDLVKVLKKILEKQELSSKDIGQIRKEIVGLEEEGFGHVQKLGVVRFNPFRETGGDHSFSLAVLDGRNSGFIITGLHTRERTRLYLKELKRGKSDAELSREETKALEKAQKATSIT